jgi:hypothetical protein
MAGRLWATWFVKNFEMEPGDRKGAGYEKH